MDLLHSNGMFSFLQIENNLTEKGAIHKGYLLFITLLTVLLYLPKNNPAPLQTPFEFVWKPGYLN